MLSIKRHRSEGITLKVDGHIIGHIVVTECGGNHVRLGLEFPQEVEIIRDELVESWHGRNIIPIEDKPPVA